MPPKRKNKLPHSYTPRRKQCEAGHPLATAYVSYDRRGNVIVKCAECHKTKMRAAHRRKMEGNSIYAQSKRVGWAALTKAQQEFAAKLRAEAAAKAVSSDG